MATIINSGSQHARRPNKTKRAASKCNGNSACFTPRAVADSAQSEGRDRNATGQPIIAHAKATD